MDLPQVSAKVDLMKWRTSNADTFPTIAKMDMQVLGCPACSSGVERLFSKARRKEPRQISEVLKSPLAAGSKSEPFAYAQTTSCIEQVCSAANCHIP